MKKLFKAIREKGYELVLQLIDRNPGLVNCTAKQPPKKDDGQSPLQIALRSGAFDIAELLIDRGADLNYMEDETCCNSWRAPVVHDAITAAVMNSRWNTNHPCTGLKVFSTEEKAVCARRILEKMLQSGSDVNRLDSYGNSGIWRFCSQASQICQALIPQPIAKVMIEFLTTELETDLLNILNLLCKYGADMNYMQPNIGLAVKEYYTGGAMAKLLAQVE